MPANSQSGDAALAALAEQSFDVMVTDIQMPGLTGLKLLRAVRELDLELPVVLITGNPGLQSAVDAVEYGAYRYLIKPVPMQELRAVAGRAGALGRLARSKREYLERFGSGKFRVGDRAGIDAMLDRALASLWTAYQPIVRAVDRSIFAYEALMRVEEPMLPHPGAVLAKDHSVDGSALPRHGKHIVAEGIETPGERDALTELGCDLLQGYLFAKPGRAEG